jgi:hypothetical protein
MSEILLFQDAERKTNVNVRLDGDTVWLTQKALAELFGVDRSVITKHMRNIFKECELAEDSVCANFAHTVDDGKTYSTNYYNLDAIISVGYRVNPVRTTRFRQWATQTLNDNLIKGLSLNQQRLDEQCLAEAQELINLLSRAILRQENLNEERRNRQVLALISKYAKTWKALAEYDEHKEKDQIRNSNAE